MAYWDVFRHRYFWLLMAYGDEWQREWNERFCRWAHERYFQEIVEQDLAPDDRLDEVGWDIFYAAVSRGMERWDAARLAMDGTYRKRLLVRRDMMDRLVRETQRRFQELRCNDADPVAANTAASEQLAFWSKRLASPSFVYFIQEGDAGPVKIGLSRRPERRLRQLQTGNPNELRLRHVAPGTQTTETHLHRRFEPARIRGEWFGLAYLSIILTFAGGLADEMLRTYDGSGVAPTLAGTQVRSPLEVARIRRDIERLWKNCHELPEIAELTGLGETEVDRHFDAMRASTYYDLWRFDPARPRRPRVHVMRARAA